MPKDIEFVQIEAGEDATSVRDRLSFLRGKNVLLIWPEEGTALTRKLDLVLVQREAMRRAIRLALVTHDPLVMNHARELNISTFETIGASQRGRWKRGRTKVFANRHQKPDGEPEPQELMEVASRVRAPVKLPMPTLARLTLMLIVLAALGGVAYVALPSATVTLTIPVTRVSADSVITALPSASAVDVENGVIPARVQPVELQESGTRAVTGQQDVPDTFAAGTVTFVNKGDTPVEIAAGTVVLATADVPVRFLTTSDALLPAGVDQRVEVSIEAAADSSGDRGNVAAGQINTVQASWAEQVTVTNLTATGGGETRVLPVVTQSDIDLLQSTIRQQLFTRALSELTSYLTDSEFVIEETLSITSNRADWIELSANVGDFAESVTMSMRAIVEAVIINTRFGERVAFANLGRVIQGRAIEPGSIEYTRGPILSVGDDDSVQFALTASAEVVPTLNTADLSARLAGLSISEAQTYLAGAAGLPAGTTADFEINSPWGGDRLPPLPLRIAVVIVKQGAP